MRTFAVDDANDMFLDMTGGLAIYTDLAAITQCLESAMKAQQGEMMYAADDGMPTLETAWSYYNPAAFEAAARRVILAVDGVLQVTAFSVTYNGETLQYAATISTIYGEASING